ncbi:MAG: hypothetical protein AAF519_05085 [Bacteroidota bacterium]
MVKNILFLCFFLLFMPPLSAQYYLQLKKRNKVIHTYASGDNIIFRLKDDKFYYDQMITGVTGTTIKFRFYDVTIQDIEVVKVPSRSSYGLDLLSGAALTAGVFFLAIDQGNQLFVQGEGLGPSDEVLIVTGALVGTGVLIKLLKKKKFRFKSRKYRLVSTAFLPEGN